MAPGEQQNRPAIDRNLVDCQNEQARRGRPCEEDRPQQRYPAKIKGTADLHLRPTHGIPFGRGFEGRPEVLDFERSVSGGGGDGNGLAVDRGEAVPEDLVALNDGVQALLERRDIEKARDAPGERHVVDGIRRLRFAQEPEAFLGKREGPRPSRTTWTRGGAATCSLFRFPAAPRCRSAEACFGRAEPRPPDPCLLPLYRQRYGDRHPAARIRCARRAGQRACKRLSISSAPGTPGPRRIRRPGARRSGTVRLLEHAGDRLSLAQTDLEAEKRLGFEEFRRVMDQRA